MESGNGRQCSSQRQRCYLRCPTDKKKCRGLRVHTEYMERRTDRQKVKAGQTRLAPFTILGRSPVRTWYRIVSAWFDHVENFTRLSGSRDASRFIIDRDAKSPDK